MDLEALGNIGDFVGGLAVLATLVYLAFQIRQNTLEVRNAAVQRILEQSTSIFSSELSLKALDIPRDSPEELSEQDKKTLLLFMRRNFQLFEQVYLQSLVGRIDQDVMSAYESRIRFHFDMPFVWGRKIICR